MLPWLSRDGKLFLAGRALRTFSYGAVSVILGVYLGLLGLSPAAVGAVLTATLLGDALLTVLVTFKGERLGRRRSLVLLSLSTAMSALLFLWAPVPALLFIAPLFGIIASSGKDAGAFVVLGQAILPQTVPPTKRTTVFALDTLTGEGALALGALASGLPSLLMSGEDVLAGFRWLFLAYAVLSIGMAGLSLALSPATEAPRQAATPQRAFLATSRRPVFRLAGLFAVDAAGGGLVLHSFLAYWFFTRFGLSPEGLGVLFFFASVLSAVSALVAAWLAGRIGLVNTMVFTHIPANLIIMAIPLVPSAPAAMGLFLVRQFFSQMDVPTRQSYTMAIVPPEERVAAAGVTNLSRFGARAIGPSVGGILFQSVSSAAPLIAGGGIKLVYDLSLYALFRHMRPPEEARPPVTARP